MYSVHEAISEWQMEIKWLGWSWEFSTETQNSSRHTRSSAIQVAHFHSWTKPVNKNCIGIYSHPPIYLWPPLFIIQWHRWNGCDRLHMLPKSKLFTVVLFKKIIIKLTNYRVKTQYLVHPSGFSNTV